MKRQNAPNVIPVQSKGKKKGPVKKERFDADTDFVEDLDDLFPDEEPKKRSRKKKDGSKKSGKKIWIISGSIVAALVLIYIGVSVFFMSHFYINTEINGKDFSAKTAADVEEYLKTQVKDYKLVVKEKDNKSDTIEGSEIGLTYKENDDIEKALKKQNGFAWPAAFFSKNSSKVTIEVSLSLIHISEPTRH